MAVWRGSIVGAAEGCEGGSRFAAFGSSYRELRMALIPRGDRGGSPTGNQELVGEVPARDSGRRG